MVDYVGTSIQMPNVDKKDGCVSDCLDVIASRGSSVSEGLPHDMDYSGFLRKGYRGNGRYESNEKILQDLHLRSDALAKAIKIAFNHNVPVFFRSHDAQSDEEARTRKVIWHPEGWEPNEG